MRAFQRYTQPMGKRGRKMAYPDKLPILGLPPGALERLEQVLLPGEGRPDLIREAVLQEIARREAALVPLDS